MEKKEKLGFKYSCAMPLMETVRKLSYEKKVELCKEFHRMVNEEYSSERGMFIDRFEEVYHLIDFDDIYGDRFVKYKEFPFIGIELKDIRSAPVGSMQIVDMFPMDLEEFFIAIGIRQDTLDLIRKHYSDRSSIDTYIHQRLLDAYYLYLITGGMPEAVQTYVDSNDLSRVAEVHEKITRLYRLDFAKYEEKNKLKLREIYDAIPGELEEKNKRFFINHIDGKTGYDKVRDDFLWLKSAGVALPVYNVTEPMIPLAVSEKRNLFKLFLSDVGLLTNRYPASVRFQLLNKERGIKNGGLFENAVAQELYAKGFHVYYYNSKRQGELDFVIELNGNVLPIEVKSGKDYKRHQALNNVINTAFIVVFSCYYCLEYALGRISRAFCPSQPCLNKL